MAVLVKGLSFYTLQRILLVYSLKSYDQLLA
jgi:hypothetical protein